MKTGLIALAAALAVAIPTMVVNAENACPDQNVHTYGVGGSVGYDLTTVRSTELNDGAGGVGLVSVTDTNAANCNDGPHGDAKDPPIDDPDDPTDDYDNGTATPDGDWDGDYDAGVGGAFFGYGTHAINDACGYDLNVGGGHVVVDDLIFADVTFVTAENDQNGPILVPIVDPVTNEQIGSFCDTPGGITPGVDNDDCISDADGNLTLNGYTSYKNEGDTCGTGGGDGGFWVFLDGAVAADTPPGIGNPPTTGTITRS